MTKSISLIGIQFSALILSLSTTSMSALMMWSMQDDIIYQILAAIIATGLQIGQFCLPTALSSTKKVQSTLIVTLSFFLLSTSVFASVFFLERTVQQKITPIVQNNKNADLIKASIDRKKESYELKFSEGKRLIAERTYRTQGKKMIKEAEEMGLSIDLLEANLLKANKSQSFLPFYLRNDFEKERLFFFAIFGLLIDVCAMVCVYVSNGFKKSQSLKSCQPSGDSSFVGAGRNLHGMNSFNYHNFNIIKKTLINDGKTSLLKTIKEPVVQKQKSEDKKTSTFDSIDRFIVQISKRPQGVNSKLELMEIFYNSHPSIGTLNLKKKHVQEKINILVNLGFVTIQKKSIPIKL